MSKHHVSAFEMISRFIPFLWKNKSFNLRLGVVVALLLIPFTIAIQLCLPILFKEIINKLNNKIGSTEFMVLSLIFAYGFFWTVGTLAEKLREMVFFRPTCRAITEYSITVYKHLQSLNLNFHLGRQTGKITTAIDSAQLATAMVITNILFRMIPPIVMVLAMIIITAYLYGLFYAALLIATVIIFSIWGLYGSYMEMKSLRQWIELDGRATARFVDGLINIETVKYFNRRDHEIATAQKLNNLLRTLEVNHIFTFSSIQMIYACIAAVGLGLITYYAAIDTLTLKLNIGDFILINSYAIQLFGPLYQLTGDINDTKFNLSKMQPSAELLNEKDSVEAKDILPSLVIDKAEIKFENVHLSYLPEVPILKNLTFTVPAGKKIAIVGPSGCGKSTIARLLLRLFDPSSGHIHIDNQDIQHCDPYSIRKVIGCVPQDIALFNDTLRYNICYGTFDCSDAELNNILHITQLQDFIQKLPLGLNTEVGERGLKLSGGERQRIAIARALIKNPAILVFDEATSSLDVKTEQTIQENLAKATKNITTVVIAHRLSTIIDADNIIVLDNGVVVEQGTHAQLLQHNGLYAALWRLQRLKEAV